jgi:hypothetical protein
VTSRLTFLSHFVICLAIAAGAYFAYRAGIPQLVWENDLSKMTSVIAGLFVVTAVWLGWQAWLVDLLADRERLAGYVPRGARVVDVNFPDASFGHLAERLAVIFGFVGTAYGLSLQGHSLATNGAASFEALATSLYTTFTAGAAAAGIAILTYSLEHGIAKARR